jgi:glycosyltransferase involved in cell wall biosynthesis
MPGSKPLRVLQVVPSLLLGGAEHVGAYLGCQFSQPGLISVCSLYGGPLEAQLRQRGISYRVFEPKWRSCRNFLKSAPGAHVVRAWLRSPSAAAPTWAGTVRLASTWQQLSALRGVGQWLSEILRRNEYDVVHLHSLQCAGLIAAARERARAIVFGHHNMLSQRHGPEDTAYLISQLPAVDRVVCPSQASRSDFVQVTGYPAFRVQAIPNPSFFAGSWGRRESQLPVCLGTISNLGPAKGIDVLLAAGKLLRLKGLRLRLEIAGGDPKTVTYWKAVAQGLGWEPQPVFLGQLKTAEEIDGFYRRLDALLVPSRSEAFPLILVEALSRGLPVVASDIPTLREILRGAGLLFPAGDAAALAGCVERLGSDPALASSLAEAGYQLWQQRYAPAVVAAAYRAVYAEAVEQGRAVTGTISGKISQPPGGARINSSADRREKSL